MCASHSEILDPLLWPNDPERSLRVSSSHRGKFPQRLKFIWPSCDNFAANKLRDLWSFEESNSSACGGVVSIRGHWRAGAGARSFRCCRSVLRWYVYHDDDALNTRTPPSLTRPPATTLPRKRRLGRQPGQADSRRLRCRHWCDVRPWWGSGEDGMRTYRACRYVVCGMIRFGCTPGTRRLAFASSSSVVDSSTMWAVIDVDHGVQVFHGVHRRRVDVNATVLVVGGGVDHAAGGGWSSTSRLTVESHSEMTGSHWLTTGASD